MTVLICILITASVLFYVFYLPGKLPLVDEKTRLNYLHERKEAVYENLRDLNFEYRAGKFPEGDYLAMRASLEEEAAAILAEIARLEQASGSIRVRKEMRL
jgi:outer membrane protein TolC